MYFTYILSNKWDTVLYVGSTNNLAVRLTQHYTNTNSKSFSARYNLCKLVYFETYDQAWFAVEREKQIKKWSRRRKDDLINTINPKRFDLSGESVDIARG
ncbi:GIY-YIG nuclease family protein [Candidatus Dojkabacteria bacterium]|uniref:GIY-YIG nuclease family protein n=1 Tax=Candidatus Dojkabacteria bacterium TaxID=2099670 RepID=A0A955LB67_9BACT|nr:GIY-YIG nuclease family protein [Candidatus Dojkabacteria bacterium]